MVRLTAVLLILHFVCSAAAAKDVKVGDVALELPLPPGHCELDVVQASDAPLVAAVHSRLRKIGHRLLNLSADCGELRDLRNDKRRDLDHMAQYQTVANLEEGPLPDTPELVVKGYCDELRLRGDPSIAVLSPDARATRAFEMLKVNQGTFLGIIDEDKLVCYASLLEKSKTESGGEKAQVTVFAITVIKGKVISHYLYAPYAGSETVTPMLAKERATVGRLQRANRE
jgi:hypothetical protein